jgi:hypothetical protein
MEGAARVVALVMVVVVGVTLIAAPFLLAPPAVRPLTLGDNPLLHHSFSGWSISTPQDARQAAQDGIRNVFLYGDPYAASTPMGRVLSGLRLSQVDGDLWTYLEHYECHRLLTRGLQPAGTQGLCGQETHEDAQHLWADVTQHLNAVKDDPAIVGFWVLDDWPWTVDPGGARTLLQELTRQVHALAPGKPTICGFGAELGVGRTDVWAPELAQNFSPMGCDVVGLDVYSQSVPDVHTSPGTFDWSMSTLLPKIRAALAAQGWKQNKEPLIGIVQAWAGARDDWPGYYEIVPTAAEIARQALSFCKAGAVGIVFYGWGALQTPANSAAIRAGLRQAIAQCTAVWR